MDDVELLLACDCGSQVHVGPAVQVLPDGSTSLGVRCRWCAVRPWWRDLGPFA